MKVTTFSELLRLIGICRCITTKGGLSTQPCGNENCVRCVLMGLTRDEGVDA